jgi:hypothetical protein
LFPNVENQAIFEQVRDTGQPVEFHAKPFEFPDQPERGVTHWDWTLAPVTDEDGQVEGLVLSLLDVTERVRAESQRDATLEVLQERTKELGERRAHGLSWRVKNTERRISEKPPLGDRSLTSQWVVSEAAL